MCANLFSDEECYNFFRAAGYRNRLNAIRSKPGRAEKSRKSGSR